MLFRTIIAFIVYSNVWISLGATGFSLLYFHIFKLPLNNHFIFFIFSSTLFIYNFQRLVKFHFYPSSFKGNRPEWIKQHLIFNYVLTGLSFIAGMYFGFEYIFKVHIWPILFVISFVSVFYVCKIPFTKYNLRSIPGLKIYLISIIWVFATVILPHYLFSNQAWDVKFTCFILGTGLFTLSISIPFDIRDLLIDEESKKTIPQKLGVRKSKRLAIFLWIISHILFMLVAEKLHFGLFLHCFLGAVLIFMSNTTRGKLFFSGLVDGLMISLPLLYYLF